VSFEGRRQFLVVLASALGGVPLLAWLTSPPPVESTAGTFPIEKSDEEWRRALTSAQYKILRRRGTERPFTSSLNREHRTGTFACAACARRLFDSAAKFESGTGWPSFWQPLDRAVETSVDRSWFMVRTEVHCSGCGGHLGHVFEDGPQPTGLRYCINGIALTFEAKL
jgi:peptide-methionine (R)-S-oxide reductase